MGLRGGREVGGGGGPVMTGAWRRIGIGKPEAGLGLSDQGILSVLFAICKHHSSFNLYQESKYNS